MASLASSLNSIITTSNATLFAMDFTLTTSSSFGNTVKPVEPNVSAIPVVQEDVALDPRNNPDDLMTFQAYDITEKLTNCFFGPVLLLIGVPTNILNCLVFYKQGLRDRMNLCLFVLALVDALFVASSFVVGFYSFLSFVDYMLWMEYSIKIQVYLIFFMWAMKSASGCITMVVAVERCVCVVFPLRANSIMRTRTMGALLAAIVILNTLGFSIQCFRNKLVEIYDSATGLTLYKIEIAAFFVKNHMFYVVFFEIILWFLLPLVTFVVVGVATAITVVKLKTAMAWRARSSSGREDNCNQQQQAALTKMLVILSCVFMACSAPQMALSIVRILVPDYAHDGRYVNFFYATHMVAVHITAPVNSAINFFVYYARSSRFRADVRELCSCGKAKDKLKAKKEEVPMTIVSEY